MNIPKVEIYSDWWSVPNPWKWWYWVILCHKWIKKEFSQGFKVTTNNRMELTWVIVWLSKLKTKSQVEIFTDSQYTINGIKKWWAEKWKKNNWYRTKSEKAVNADLWEKLLALSKIHKINFNWVKWHSWHIENERCDELATLAINSWNLIDDKWFKSSKLTPLFTEKKDEKKQLINKKNTNKIEKSWDVCWKCWESVIKKIPKKKKLKPSQTFYYEYFFYCSWCWTNYMTNEWKKYINK